MGCCVSSEPQEEGGRETTGGNQHLGSHLAFPDLRRPPGLLSLSLSL